MPRETLQRLITFAHRKRSQSIAVDRGVKDGFQVGGHQSCCLDAVACDSARMRRDARHVCRILLFEMLLEPVCDPRQSSPQPQSS